MKAPKRCALSSRTSRLAASSSGACGAQSCHAATVSGVRRDDHVEHGRPLRRHGGEDELGHDAEAASARAFQRPQQVGVVVGVDDPAVGQHDRGGDQLVARQPVLAAEDADPTAERQAGDPDRRPAAGDDRAALLRERVVDRAELRAGADRRSRSVEAHVVDRADVDQRAGGGRASGEAVAAAADREPVAAPDRVRHLLGRAALDDPARSDVRVARERGAGAVEVVEGDRP